jgi:hypothetical protein
MLHALPFITFGEAAAFGLEAHVYCPSCYTTRQVDPAADRLRHRCFAGTRLRPGLGDDPAARAAARGR